MKRYYVESGFSQANPDGQWVRYEEARERITKLEISNSNEHALRVKADAENVALRERLAKHDDV